MLDHYQKILERIKDRLRMVDTVLDFKKELVLDQHANTSMR
jgi:hypothetical protein